MKLILVFSCLMLLVGCADQGSWSDSADDSAGYHVIYGDNSIRNPKPEEDSQSSITVGFIDKAESERNDNGLTGALKVSEQYAVDGDFRYGYSLSEFFCSGVVIGKNKVLTMAHCFEEKKCEETVLYFKYREFITFKEKKKEKRNCKSVKKRIIPGIGLEYAVVEIDKNIKFEPPKISQSDVKIGQELYVLGHPLGIEQRYASGIVRKFDDKANIVTNLDVFEGNSGSPVFAKDSGELVGIYSSGESDFMTDVNGNERMVKCSDTGCGGEIVIPIKKIIEDMANQQ